MTGSAAVRSACGNGSMDDDEHALYCIACNIARHSEWSRNRRLCRHPKPWPRRLLNRVMRFVVQGDPTFLPDGDDPHGKVGYVR